MNECRIDQYKKNCELIDMIQNHSAVEDIQENVLDALSEELDIDISDLLSAYPQCKPGWKRLHPHKLRHTTATTLAKDGADILTIQKRLGHESSATTEIYTHLDQSDIAKAVSRSSLSELGAL